MDKWFDILNNSLLFTAICKASPDSFCFFAFLFHGDGLDPCLLYSVTNLIPSQAHCSPGTGTQQS